MFLQRVLWDLFVGLKDLYGCLLWFSPEKTSDRIAKEGRSWVTDWADQLGAVIVNLFKFQTVEGMMLATGVGFGRWFSAESWWGKNKNLSCLSQALGSDAVKV